MTGEFGDGLARILEGFGAVLGTFGEGHRTSKERTSEAIATKTAIRWETLSESFEKCSRKVFGNFR